jgi:ElaB/YqjD/DUF883 family membrane-anchored ribosome-binding protein
VDEEYPLATVTGTIRRTRPSYVEDGRSYSDFADDAGKRFKALTDDAGRRAGDFMDDAGRYFRGFSDSAGRKIHDVRDETGAMLDDASGWASDTWRGAKQSMRGMADGVANAADKLRSNSSNAMDSVMQQSGHLGDLINGQFRDQPLVGGALAFAVGAALGAALPHTRQEDQLMGETADKMRSGAMDQATDLMDKGSKVAGDVLDKAVAVAADVHDAAKDRILDEAKRSGYDGNGRATAH